LLPPLRVQVARSLVTLFEGIGRPSCWLSPPEPLGPPITEFTGPPGPRRWVPRQTSGVAGRRRSEGPGLSCIPPGQGKEAVVARADSSITRGLVNLTDGEWLKTRKKSRSYCGSALPGGGPGGPVIPLERGPVLAGGDRPSCWSSRRTRHSISQNTPLDLASHDTAAQECALQERFRQTAGSAPSFWRASTSRTTSTSTSSARSARQAGRAARRARRRRGVLPRALRGGWGAFAMLGAYVLAGEDSFPRLDAGKRLAHV
jgi:hypothetical protein